MCPVSAIVDGAMEMPCLPPGCQGLEPASTGPPGAVRAGGAVHSPSAVLPSASPALAPWPCVMRTWCPALQWPSSSLMSPFHSRHHCYFDAILDFCLNPVLYKQL